MASRENFFTAHWDWLVAGLGVLALVGSAVLYVNALGVSPEAGAERCRERLLSQRPAHEGVPPADMTLFQNVFRKAKAPPKMVELEAQKGSFLASSTRIVCKAENDAKSADGKPMKGCGRPIPIEVKSCPFCGVVQDTGITKEEESVRKMREWSERYGVDIVNKPDVDTDKDGFTDLEEYEIGVKDGVAYSPKDADSHPDYLGFLFVEGEMKQTFLPFYLQTVSPVPNGWRFNFRDSTNKKNAYGQATVYSVLKDEPIGKTGFVAVKYEKKSEERLVKGSKNLKKAVDVSTVELVRKSDGKKVVARISERLVPMDRQVTLAFRRGEGKTFTVKAGDEISLFSRKYSVVSLGDDAKNPKVRIMDVLSKAETVISANGRVSQ